MVMLGINEGANSSVCVYDGGRIRFAVQEERVARKKEFIGFPHEALAFTLAHCGLTPKDIEAVCLSNLASPTVTRSAFLADYDDNLKSLGDLIGAGEGRAAAKRLFRRLPAPLRLTLRRARYGGMNQSIEEALAAHGLAGLPVNRFSHHSNHAASAYFAMRRDPDERHLVLTLDGGGDDTCATVHLAEGGRMTLIARTPFGHSLGQIYGRVTHLMGMTPHEHEYKLMGMAPYADPKYVAPALDILRGYLDLDPDDPLLFKRKIPEETGFIGRRLLRDFRRVRFDSLAGAVQAFAEELMVKWVRAAIARTGVTNVVAGGGVFMNVRANKAIAELPEIEFFDVLPSCGDETLPFGSVWQAAFAADPAANETIALDDVYLGPEAATRLDAARQAFAGRLSFDRQDDANGRIADLLAEGAVVARCAGRMEFGARALGNRSVLADPANERVVTRINKMIKKRDFWMPFAPAMTAAAAETYLRLPPSVPRPRLSPYMMHSFDTTDRRDDLFAGTHPYDGTARAQIVHPDTASDFHAVIARFGEITGRPVVLNSSFNLHGFPIVMDAMDACQVMCETEIEHLFIDDIHVTKKP